MKLTKPQRQVLEALTPEGAYLTAILTNPAIANDHNHDQVAVSTAIANVLWNHHLIDPRTQAPGYAINPTGRRILQYPELYVNIRL